jgi:hypothetical protein
MLFIANDQQEFYIEVKKPLARVAGGFSLVGCCVGVFWYYREVILYHFVS